jgi:hypothetical protein
LPELDGVNGLDRLLKSVHLSGFAVEYPDGSLQNLILSRRRNAQWAAAQVLTTIAPQRSAARRWLRRAYGRYRPRRPLIEALFDEVRPACVLVASPGHYWLDHFVLDEAARRGIPSVCVVLSWDNLYSRGPLCRRPDWLFVWSEEMRRQALDVHQVAADRIAVTGPVQFVHYQTPPDAAELAGVRRRLGLAPDVPYLAYVCGARTSTYDVEDVRAMLTALRAGPYAGWQVVVRPHPQGDRRAYAALTEHGVVLDETLDITAGDARPDAFDVSAVRHMAAFLGGAAAVVSSWGTTALLEACVFDRPALQLRWMDAIPHSVPDDVQKVRDFQRYLHMRPFDAIGARPYCDHPDELNGVIGRLLADEPGFRQRRAETVARLTALPLGGAIDRVCAAMEPVLGPGPDAEPGAGPRPARPG